MRLSPISHQKQKGIGLISAIALITLAALLSIAIMRTVRTVSDSSVQAIVSFRAFLAAESGAHLAANRIIPPSGAGSCVSRNYDFENMGLPSCRASVDCRETTVEGESIFTVQSTATCEPQNYKATHSVVVRLSG